MKLSSLIISRIPQDTLRDVKWEGLKEGGVEEVGDVMSYHTSVKSSQRASEERPVTQMEE